MKLKYYLRGLGIGILVTSIIFIIGMHVNQDELISDEQVMARAKELGMVMGENEIKTLDELENKEEKEQNKEDTKTEDTKTEDTKAEDNTKQKKEDTSAQKEADKQTEAAKENEPQTVKQIEISILPGEYSRTISQKLLDAGVITDQAEFNQFITENNYDNLIQPGTFTIPEGSSYEKIAKILTTKQENR